MQKLAIALTALAFVSCVGSEVTQIGPQRPGRSVNCEVQIIPGTSPGPVVNLASVRANCDFSVGRKACFDELRRQTCALGGDTIYALSESVDRSTTYITGTVAWRGTPGDASENGERAACTPICSPGFDCRAGHCVPLCNPACAATEVCNLHRVCEPAPGRSG